MGLKEKVLAIPGAALSAQKSAKAIRDVKEVYQNEKVVEDAKNGKIHPIKNLASDVGDAVGDAAAVATFGLSDRVGDSVIAGAQSLGMMKNRRLPDYEAMSEEIKDARDDGKSLSVKDRRLAALGDLNEAPGTAKGGASGPTP